MIALPIPNSVKFNIVKILANNPSIERYSIPKSFKNIDLVIKDNKIIKVPYTIGLKFFEEDKDGINFEC